jgi:hypothetical protein
MKNEEGFICHRASHWFAMRRIGPFWFDLDSKLQKPKLISPNYLCTTLGQLQKDGCSVFVVRGLDDFGPGQGTGASRKQLPIPTGPSTMSHTGDRVPGSESCWHPLDYLLPADDNEVRMHFVGTSTSGTARGSSGPDKQGGGYKYNPPPKTKPRRKRSAFWWFLCFTGADKPEPGHGLPESHKTRSRYLPSSQSASLNRQADVTATSVGQRANSHPDPDAGKLTLSSSELIERLIREDLERNPQ